MMRKNIFFFLLLIAGSINAQKHKSTTDEPNQKEFERYSGIYEKAISLNDFNVATMACYEMISLMPSRKDLNDTLAMLYYAQNAYQQAAVIADGILKEQPDNRNIRELSAMCFDQMGDLEKALAQYAELYKKHGELYYLYKTASLEFLMKKFDSADANLNVLLQHSQAMKQFITMAVSAQSSETQQINIAAAAYNVKGVMAMEQQKFAEAKVNFEQAIELSPGFKNALGNLETLRKRQNSVNKAQ
jgi:tetratricopeptide (TPR) repeat protein